MDVSVTICTWNRAESLRRCLSSLTQLIIPEGLNWEVLVVNNGSTDNTREVVTEFKQLLPIRLIYEPKLGLSKARNTGVGNASGELIIFFDDDVLVGPFCVRGFWNAASAYPEAKLFGGLIEPLMEGITHPKSSFLDDPFFDGLILRKDLGSKARLLKDDEYFFGACFAVKKDFLNQSGFDTHLGKKGNEQILGEEIALQERAKKGRVIRVWVPEAKVKHIIPAQRLSYSESGRYFRGMGRTHSLLEKPFFLPRLSSFTLFGFWAQLHFLLGYWFQKVRGEQCN
ncbi:MAG: glycosyltransferase family 2 protein [Proteobacteria bacterium]|nr:glycosyltransferase family 2 protein [Pseudomonadota bacterium]NDG26843.1 glycosyltransferase family 2 protein [Pseudomonadota bacterium]